MIDMLLESRTRRWRYFRCEKAIMDKLLLLQKRAYRVTVINVTRIWRNRLFGLAHTVWQFLPFLDTFHAVTRYLSLSTWTSLKSALPINKAVSDRIQLRGLKNLYFHIGLNGLKGLNELNEKHTHRRFIIHRRARLSALLSPPQIYRKTR